MCKLVVQAHVEAAVASCPTSLYSWLGGLPLIILSDSSTTYHKTSIYILRSIILSN